MTTPAFTVAPAASNPTAFGHDITATLDVNGILHIVRLADGAAAPSSAQVKARQDASGAAAPEADSVAATARVAASLTFSTGEPSKAVDYYVVAEDDNDPPNIQAAPTLVEDNTLARNLDYPQRMLRTAVRIRS